MFGKISQISVSKSLFNKVLDKICTLSKNPWHMCFPVNFVKIFRRRILESISSLHKIPNIYLISWHENFVERHSSRKVLGDYHWTSNIAFPQNFQTRKLGEISVLYAVTVSEKGIFTLTNLLHHSQLAFTCLNVLRYLRRSGVFIAGFEHISHLVLVLLLLILNM